MMHSFRKAIAVFVAVALLSLLQLSAAPLGTATAPAGEDAVASAAEQAPSFIEEEGYASAAGKKKSILPIVIGVVAVGAIAAVLALVVLKTKYDITGTWEFAFTSTTPAHSWTWTLVCRGDKKSGTFDDAGDSGTYTVDGKDVSLRYDDWEIVLTGAFDDKDRMSGSATFANMTIGQKEITSATWVANRVSAAGSLPPGNAAAAPGSRKGNK